MASTDLVAARYFPRTFIVAWVLALLFTLSRKRPAAISFTLLSSFLLGASLYLLRSYQLQEPDPLAQLYGYEWAAAARLRGSVSEFSASSGPGGRATFVLNVDSIMPGNDPPAHWRPIKGRTTINWYEGDRSVQEGDVLEVSGKLRLLSGFRNPDMFDYERYMRRRGIYTRMVARGPVVVPLVTRANLSSATIARYHLRRKAMEIISLSSRSEESRAFLSAVVLGERGLLTAEMKNWFKETGTFHILAISGLHIGLVYLMISLALTPLSLDIKARVALSLIIVWSYAIVTGLAIPVTRASIMLTLVLAGYLLDREGDFLTAIAVAAFILFLVDPLSLEDVSFQLSFVAVILLCSFEPIFSQKLYPLLQRQLPAVPPPIMHKLAVSLFASVVVGTGLTPIIAYHFNQISLVFPLANLLVIPLLSVALALGFAQLLAGFLWLPAAALVGFAAEAACQLIFLIVRVFSGLPFSSMHVGSPPLWTLGLVAAGICLLWSKAGWKKKGMILSCLLLFGMTSALAGKLASRDIVRTTFFDLGDADSCLLEFPGNKKMLVDAGFSSVFFDCGENLIAPYLWRRNIGTIDVLAITHSDADHCGGASFILDNFRVNRLLLPETRRIDERFTRLIEAARERGAAVSFAKAGDLVDIDPKIRIEILNPPANASRELHSNNNLSLVLRVISRNVSILLAADAEDEALHALSCSGLPFRSAILKAPHHGLKSSFNRDFVERVSPELIVISGRTFRENDHMEKRISRYAPLCPRVVSTQKEGAIIIESRDGSYTVRSCRNASGSPH